MKSEIKEGKDTFCKIMEDMGYKFKSAETNVKSSSNEKTLLQADVRYVKGAEVINDF